MIYDTLEQIQEKLAEAKHIYYFGYYGDLVVLKYDDGRLIASSPFGGEAFKPVADVAKIEQNSPQFNEYLKETGSLDCAPEDEVYQVIWKV